MQREPQIFSREAGKLRGEVIENFLKVHVSAAHRENFRLGHVGDKSTGLSEAVENGRDGTKILLTGVYEDSSIVRV
jgi:hypothetical protein